MKQKEFNKNYIRTIDSKKVEEFSTLYLDELKHNQFAICKDEHVLKVFNTMSEAKEFYNNYKK